LRRLAFPPANSGQQSAKRDHITDKSENRLLRHSHEANEKQANEDHQNRPTLPGNGKAQPQPYRFAGNQYLGSDGIRVSPTILKGNPIRKWGVSRTHG
jgi:hypothetical protein